MNQAQVSTALGPHPAHVRLKALKVLLQTIEEAIADKRVVSDFDATQLTKLAFDTPGESHPWWPMIDQYIHVKRQIISPRLLLFMLKLRIDLNRNESDWSKSENQLRMSDICGAYHDESPWADVWTNEPILFWTLSQVMRVLLKTQEKWNTMQNCICTEQLLNALSTRIALLTTFHFDGVTLDDQEYRTVVQTTTHARQTYVSSLAFMWDVATLLIPMYRDLWADNSQCEAYSGPSFDNEPLKKLVRRIVYRMHGDNLPAIYAKKYISNRIMKGNRDWYIRRRSLFLDFNEKTIRDIDIIRECRGDVYAKQIHENAGKPLNEVFGVEPLQVELLNATMEYYARQSTIRCSKR